MEIPLKYYLFLSLYIPLPLSALKFIAKNDGDPFNKINQLSTTEIENHLEFLHKQPGIIIRNKKEKAQKIINLISRDFIDKIPMIIDKWEENGIQILSYFDDKYPKRIKGLKNAPKVLFCKGKINFKYDKAISIIGTRNPTEFGRTMTFKISERFAKLGFMVINGFAKGIDTEAIKGALKAGGKVIGVMGSGLLHPYPKTNLELFDDIVDNEKGFFISEQLPDNQITKSGLATRNRLSSSLSLGNVFVEGSIKSGARWQLKYGLEQSKPVIVVEPKKRSLEQAELPNHIIRNKKNDFLIKKVEDVDEIVDSILKKEKKEISEQGYSQKSIYDF